MRKACADELIRAQVLKGMEEERCRKEAEKELNRLRTLKPDYVEEMLLQSSVPVDEVEDSLPPRKKTVNKHRIIQDDSSDVSCSNCDSATPSKNNGAGGNGGNGCAALSICSPALSSLTWPELSRIAIFATRPY